jgi:hypothetical protein
MNGVNKIVMFYVLQLEGKVDVRAYRYVLCRVGYDTTTLPIRIYRK